MGAAPGAAPHHSLAGEVVGAARIAHNAGGLLLDHLGLTAQLARVEWAEERARLERVVVNSLLRALALLLAAMHASALALVLAWDTPWRIHVAAGLLLLTLGLWGYARRRAKTAMAEATPPFAGTTRELHKTIDLLRSHL